MGLIKRAFAFKDTIGNSNAILNLSYYVADLITEIPLSGMNKGDLLVCLENLKFYIADSSTSWNAKISEACIPTGNNGFIFYNDPKLTDLRNPLPHTHPQYADVTNYNTQIALKVNTSDGRLSDNRNPLPHVHPQYADITNYNTQIANKVDSADGRLSDNRNPLPHAHPQYADVTNYTTQIALRILTSDGRLSDSRNPLPHIHPQYADVTNYNTQIALRVLTSDGRLSDNRNPLPHIHPQYADVTNYNTKIQTNLEPVTSQRIFVPVLAINGTFLLVSATAYFVYLGRTLQAITPKFVEFWVTTLGAGTQVAEIGLFSSPNPPNKTAQNMTLLVSTATLDSLTTTGIKRNTSAFATSIPANTHLWAGIRTAMATTQPTLRSVQDDWGQGLIETLASAAALTTAGPWAGVIPAAATQILCPALKVTMD